MKLLIVRLMLVGFAVLMVLSGAERMAGYYSDPDGYGFHDISEASFQVSLSFFIIASMAVAYASKRLERMLF